MADETPGVLVPFAQMYEQIRETHNEVREMRAEIRSALNSVDDHETRIRALEKTSGDITYTKELAEDNETKLDAVRSRMWFASGGAVVLGIVGSAALDAGLRALIGG